MAISKEKYVQNILEPELKRIAPKALVEESAEAANEGVVTTPDDTTPIDADATATTPTTARRGS